MAIGRTSAEAAQSLALDANALAGLRRQARESPDQANWVISADWRRGCR